MISVLNKFGFIGLTGLEIECFFVGLGQYSGQKAEFSHSKSISTIYLSFGLKWYIMISILNKFGFIGLTGLEIECFFVGLGQYSGQKAEFSHSKSISTIYLSFGLKWYIMISILNKFGFIGLTGLEIKCFPGSPIASSIATSRCCVKKPVHLWAP